MMREDLESGCDLLVVSPHTDDAEIALGGTMRLLADRGRSVWAVDLTGGELGSNATPDERWAEAAAASEVLGLRGRCQLELPDGFIDASDHRQVAALTAVIRALRPRWVVGAPDATRHPDHRETPRLLTKACFMARLSGFTVDAPAHRVWPGGSELPGPAERWVVDVRLQTAADGERPALLFDVTGTWEAKTRALACYRSQFHREEGRRATMINDPEFLARIERRGRTWGRTAGCPFAEALVTDQAPVVTDQAAWRWSR